MNDVRVAVAYALKDVRSEMRSKSTLVATIFFTTLTLTVLAFALGRDAATMRQAASGALWVALAFAGTIAAAQSVQSDAHDGALDTLLTLPAPRAALFLGKVATQTVTLALLGAVLAPATFIAFGAVPAVGTAWIAVVVLAGALGFATISTFYATLTAHMAARESLLPVLTFPVVIPILLAAVRATEAIVVTGNVSLARSWIDLLIGFDLVYLVVTSALFHVVVEES